MDFLIGCGVVLLIIIVAVVISAAQESKCPKCGKNFAMKQTSHKVVDARPTTMDVQREVKTVQGEVVRRYTECVPATEYFFDCVDTCKYCGYSHHVSRRKTVRD